jgi:hypothetical protein
MHHVHLRAAIDLLSPFKLTLLKADGLAIRGRKATQLLCMKGLERFFGPHRSVSEYESNAIATAEHFGLR